MADKKISELPAAESLESTDLMMVAQENVSSSSGYVSMKTTAADVADEFNTELTYSGLNTTSKTVVGAINEVKSTAEGMVEANPAGSAPIALAAIKINGVNYKIEDTGSIVRAFQVLNTGSEIGSVTVDNQETKFYVGNLNNLGDVTLTSPTDGQVLKYDATSQIWVNAAESGGGSSTLVGLTDTNISSPAADQDLSYDSTSSKWINKTHRVELTKAEYDALPSSKLTDGIEYFITDMETTGVEIVANPEDTATDTLTKLQIGDDVYNINGGSAVSDLDDLGDVDITTPTNGQILKYDSTNQVWINANESGGSGGHTILDNSGTALTQRDDLQFVGAYVNDDSANEITKVNVVREMTKAQFDLLSNAEKVGLIRVTDEDDGIGSGYRETVLWSGSETPTVSSPYTATLNDGIENYDAIAILAENDGNYVLPILLVSELIVDRFFSYVPNENVPSYAIKRLTDTTMSLCLQTSRSTITYKKVIGIKFGGSSLSPLNYSTNEQKTGQKWINGKDIYQRTYELNADIPTTGWYSLGIDASGMDFLVDTILYDNGAVFKCYSVAKLDGLIKVEASRKSGGIHANAITIQYTKTT